MSTYPLDSARYESRALRYWWAALPIVCSLLGIVLFTAGVWSAIREWLLPNSPLLTNGLFKALLLVYSVYLYMGVGWSVTFFTTKLKHWVQSEPDASAVFKVMIAAALLWAVGKSVLIGVGLLLLESITPITPLTAALLWGAALLRICLRALSETFEYFFKRTAANATVPEAIPEESQTTQCMRRAKDTPAPAPCSEGRCAGWKLLLAVLGIAVAFLLMLAMLLCAGYFPFARDGLNWQSALSALGQLLLMCAFLVGWTAFIHENGLVYRILYHTRHTPTRMAIIVDLVAVSLLLTAVFFSLTLCLALMR